MAPSKLEHRVHNLLLVLFAGLLLPATTLLLWFNYAAVVIAEQRVRFVTRKRPRSSKTVLITGASTAYGLNLAQAFFKDGHRVVSVGPHVNTILNIAKRSRAISKHYDIPNLSTDHDESYVARCLLIVAKQERADLWIDCSHDISMETITSAQRQIQQGTACLCVAPDSDSVNFLNNRETLFDFLRNRQLPAPEIHPVRSRGEIHNVLNRSQGKKQFLLKTSEKTKEFNPRAMLPRRTLSQTYQEVSLLKITPDSQLLLEEYIDASTTYRCSSVVVAGVVKMFAASQCSGDLNTSFNDKSALWKALRAYTDAIAYELGSSFTSHLTLKYLLNEKVTGAGVEQQILPIEGSLRFDPSFLFSRSSKPVNDLVLSYTSTLQPRTNGSSNSIARRSPGYEKLSVSNTTLIVTRQRYFLSNSVEELAFHPIFQLVARKMSLAQVGTSILSLIQRILFWDEAYYDFYDPLPAFWQYTVILLWQSTFGAR